MSASSPDQAETLALGTKLEDDFVAPLTAVRGALEILRDYPDIGSTERLRFVTTALRSCQQLERAVHDLADAVYGAAQVERPKESASESSSGYGARIHSDAAAGIMELDFSDLVFANSDVVYEMFDAIEAEIGRFDRKWYFLINMTGCTVWPEAWVSFAHRGKRINVNFGLETVRYSTADETAYDSDHATHPSRESAVEYIEACKQSEN